MEYKFTFKPAADTTDKAKTESVFMNVAIDDLSSDMSRKWNLSNFLTRAFNKMVRGVSDRLSNVDEPGDGFYLEVSSGHEDLLEHQPDRDLFRGETFVDVFVATPTGETVQLNDPDKPVYVSWEPKVNLPFFRASFPKFYDV